jgi:hypothetical protein
VASVVSKSANFKQISVDDGAKVTKRFPAYLCPCVVLFNLNLGAYPTQIAAARVMLNGRVAGDRRAGTVAIAIAHCVCENLRCVVITANIYLAEQDANGAVLWPWD